MVKNKFQYINREISWLQFNARVLQEARDENVPLLERLRFIGIFSNNLDEFFRVRYASVQRIVFAGKSGKKELYGMEARQLLEKITNIVINQQSESLEIIREIQLRLEDHGIFMIKEHQVTESQGEFIRDYFTKVVSPALMTFMLDDLERFPHLKDKAAYLAVKLTLDQNHKDYDSEEGKENLFALIEIPESINRFVVLPKDEQGREYIIVLDDLIRYCMDQIFSIFNYKELTAHMIKITRDAALDIDSDFKKSFIEKISKSVYLRREGDPVRFVYDKNIDSDTLVFLMDKMQIDDTDSIIPGGRYHNRRDYMKFPLYAPYQSFSYIIKFLREAAIDPKVKTIKITIYRLSSVSHVASSLINAAKNGKQVTVQIELQARFDEANNIEYAEALQEEGVKLIFGVPGLKVHCKTCLIERVEGNKIKRYGFISTGNFNESTANVYTDYTLFTTNSGILKDLNKVFNFFEINYKVNRYKHLIVSCSR